MPQGIYKIENIKNNKVYIGCSKDIHKRWIKHIDRYNQKGNKEYNKPLYQDMRKYGIENFEFTILEECDESKLEELEIKYIKDYDSINTGYNIAYGGKGYTVTGENHHNHKLTKEDVINIRNVYDSKTTTCEKEYEKYKDKIEYNGFHKIWFGQTWKDVNYKVYTDENKKYYMNIGMSRSGSTNGRALLTEEEILDIRTRRNNGEERTSVFKDYNDKIKRASFYSIWNDKNWKDIQPK